MSSKVILFEWRLTLQLITVCLQVLYTPTAFFSLGGGMAAGDLVFILCFDEKYLDTKLEVAVFC